MKLVTYATEDKRSGVGLVVGEQIVDLGGAGVSGAPADMVELLTVGPELMAEVRAAADKLAAMDPDALAGISLPPGTRLLAPVPRPNNLRDFYAFEEHVKAARALRGLDMIPEWYEIPVFYFSNPDAIYGPGEPVPVPLGTAELDFELEIACVIGKPGRDIPAERALEYVAGYTIMNDWSSRDFWRRFESKLSMGPAKSKDFATSLGPWLVTPDEIEDHREGTGAETRHHLEMTARVNGREYSRGNADGLTHTFSEMIAFASRDAWLKPGDVLGSGTVGTGCILEIRPETVGGWLKPGDVVELEIERLGVLMNEVVEREVRSAD
ncbi:MAG: fumarylacetoacetate hydrolase family protein [Chloroflexia bacterium]